MLGPFGIQKGSSKNELKVGEEISRFLFGIPSVPKPHSAFPNVYAQITPWYGVSFIRALSNPISTSGAGLELKGEFNKLTKKLTKTYGTPQIIDSLDEGGLYNEVNDWMNSIQFKERQFYAYWGTDNGLLLPNKLINIMLGVFVEDSWSGNLLLEYSFDNYEQAIDEMDELEDDAL